MNTCEICKNNFEPKRNPNSRTCSPACRAKLSHLERPRVYGEKHHMHRQEMKDRIRATWKENEAKHVKKQRATMKARYGVEFAHQVPEFKTKAVENTDYRSVWEKVKETNLERYGVENAMSNHSVARKSLDVKKHNQPSIYAQIRTHEWWDENYNGKNTTIKYLCEKFQLGQTLLTKVHQELGINVSNPKGVSAIEEKLRNAITEFATVTSNAKQVIPPKEIDIWLPEFNLAIEVNGLYWHSKFSGGKDRLYHYNKMISCKEKGIRLLQFWDFEIEKNFDLVLSMIKNACGLTSTRIYARKCEPCKISRREALEFIRHNHLNPNCKGSSYLALKYEGEIVACMVLGKSRFDKNNITEIIRFCTQRGTTVVGGFSKLLKYQPSDVVLSYSDNRYSEGNVYLKNDFELMNVGNATMWLTEDYSSLTHRSRAWTFVKDDGETQIDAAKRLGYDVVYDAGQTTWLWKRK